MQRNESSRGTKGLFHQSSTASKTGNEESFTVSATASFASARGLSSDAYYVAQLAVAIVVSTFLLSCHAIYTTRYNLSDDYDENKVDSTFLRRLYGVREDDYSSLLWIARMATFVVLIFELSSHGTFYFIDMLSSNARTLPIRGKNPQYRTTTEFMFVTTNKTINVMAIYFIFYFIGQKENVVRGPTELKFSTVVVPLVGLFFIFDFFYWIAHWTFHFGFLYKFFHKAHHRLIAPSRGCDDALVVQPLDYILIELNHLWAIHIWCSLLGLKMHTLVAVLYTPLVGILIGLSHSRYDVSLKIPFTNFLLYDTKHHDVHHHKFNYNYALFMPFWDYILGTYRPYEFDDTINLDTQLNSKTRKGMDSGEKKMM